MNMVQSGRPTHGALTRRVWEIADELLTETGTIPRGRDVVDKYLREDPSRKENTGFTQYSHWKKAQISKEKSSASSAALTLTEDGAIYLPQDVIEVLGLVPGQKFVLSRESNGIRLETRKAALKRVQALIAEIDQGTGSPVDELIAERRIEGSK